MLIQSREEERRFRVYGEALGFRLWHRECFYRRTDSVRGFNVGGVLVLNGPPASGAVAQMGMRMQYRKKDTMCVANIRGAGPLRTSTRWRSEHDLRV
jgi:hypothetical protein